MKSPSTSPWRGFPPSLGLAERLPSVPRKSTEKLYSGSNAGFIEKEKETGETDARSPVRTPERTEAQPAPPFSLENMMEELPGLACFPPRKAERIIERGSRCFLFPLLLKIVHGDQFLFQTIDPFSYEGQKQVAESGNGCFCHLILFILKTDLYVSRMTWVSWNDSL